MKKHLVANKGNTQALFSACASKYTSAGKVTRNSRSTYQTIPRSHLLHIIDFKNTPASERCSHCENRGLIMRNSQRKRQGLSPVSSLFE